MVSHGANSLRMNFLRKKILGECLLSRYQNALFRAKFIKEMKDCWKKQEKRFSPEAFPWLMAGRYRGLSTWPHLGKLWRPILAGAPLGRLRQRLRQHRTSLLPVCCLHPAEDLLPGSPTTSSTQISVKVVSPGSNQDSLL